MRYKQKIKEVKKILNLNWEYQDKLIIYLSFLKMHVSYLILKTPRSNNILVLTTIVPRL